MSSMGNSLPDVDCLDAREIRELIKETEEELEEITQERDLTLRGTGVHMGRRKALELRDEFEADQARLEERLRLLREALD